MEQRVRLYGEIQRVEDRPEGLYVAGVASTEERDDAGEIVKASAMRAALGAYFTPSLTGEISGPVREMHQLSAVGKTIAAEVTPDGVTHIETIIVDPVAIAKIRTGIYKGFSIGGSVPPGGRSRSDPKVIEALKLSEISLVDRPMNPGATFTMFKAGGAEGEGEIEKGDLPGHPFRGNQYADGAGGGGGGGGRKGTVTRGVARDPYNDDDGRAGEHRSQNAAFGFYGAMRAHESRHPTNDDEQADNWRYERSGSADVAFADARRVLARETGASEEEARGVLDSAFGRHLGEEITDRGSTVADTLKNPKWRRQALRAVESERRLMAEERARRKAAGTGDLAKVDGTNPEGEHASDATRAHEADPDQATDGPVAGSDQQGAAAEGAAPEDDMANENENKGAAPAGEQKPEGDGKGTCPKCGGAMVCPACSGAKEQAQQAEQKAAAALADLQKAEGEVAALKAERDAARDESAAARGEAKSQGERISKVATERDEAREEIAKVRSERDEASAEAAKVRGERDEALVTVAKLQAERNGIEQRLQKAAGATTAAETEITKARHARAEMEAEIAGLRRERDEAQAVITKAQAERAALEQRVQKANASIAQVEDEIAKMRATRAALEKEISGLRAERDTSAADLAKVSSDREGITERFQRAAQERDVAEKEAQKQRSAREAAESDLARERAEKAALSERVQKAKVERDALEDRLAKATRRAADAEGEITRLSGERDGLNSRLQRARSDLQITERTLASTRADKDALEMRVTKAQSLISLTEQKVTRLSAERDALEAEMKLRPKGALKAVPISKAADINGGSATEEEHSDQEPESVRDAIRKAHANPITMKLPSK